MASSELARYDEFVARETRRFREGVRTLQEFGAFRLVSNIAEVFPDAEVTTPQMEIPDRLAGWYVEPNVGLDFGWQQVTPETQLHHQISIAALRDSSSVMINHWVDNRTTGRGFSGGRRYVEHSRARYRHQDRDGFSMPYYTLLEKNTLHSDFRYHCERTANGDFNGLELLAVS